MMLISSSLMAGGKKLPVGSGVTAWAKRSGWWQKLRGSSNPVDQWNPVNVTTWRITVVQLEDDFSAFSAEEGSEPIPLLIKQNGRAGIAHVNSINPTALGFTLELKTGILPGGFLAGHCVATSTRRTSQVRITDWLSVYGEKLGRDIEQGLLEPFPAVLVPRFYTPDKAGDLLCAEGTPEIVTGLPFPVTIGNEVSLGLQSLPANVIAEQLEERGIGRVCVGFPVKERSMLEARPRTGVFQLAGKLADLQNALHRDIDTMIRCVDL